MTWENEELTENHHIAPLLRTQVNILATTHTRPYAGRSRTITGIEDWACTIADLTIFFL